MRFALFLCIAVVSIGVRGATLEVVVPTVTTIEVVTPEELNTAISGVQSTPGPEGLQGIPGPDGPQGLLGLPGADGAQGLIGPSGVQGVRGDDGAIGPQGPGGVTPDLQPILDRLDVLEALHADLLPPPEPPPPTGDTFVLMDFEEPVLRDEAWLLAQPQGTVAIIVQPKSDSGVDSLSLAVGEGRNGGNALLVESPDATAQLPGFWLAKYENKGYKANFRDDRGYMLPRPRRANRLEFWIRFEPGFKALSSAAQPPKYPNHQNLHVGTYHYDPAKLGQADTKESDNWHFYYQVFLRHDKANGEWIKVIVNEAPQHQRSIGAMPPNNPTLPAGNLWELLTRLYIDNVPYNSDPEKPYPVKMWVDDVRLVYVPETLPVTVDVVGYRPGEVVAAAAPIVLPVTLTNNSEAEICGKIGIAAYWGIRAKFDGPTDVCIAAGATLSRTLTITEPATKQRYAGITFVEQQYLTSAPDAMRPSFSDTNVERRWYSELGAFDGEVAGDFVRVILQ